MSSAEFVNHPRTREWLNQFSSDEDIVAAKLLLGMLDLVTGSHAERHLLRTLTDFDSEHDGKVAIFTLRDLTTTEKTSHFFGMDEAHKPRKFEPKGGSDGRTGHFTRDAQRAHSAVLDHPSIATMRQHKVRWIVFVDDNLSSGNRAVTLVKHFHSHPTIRSWHSLGWVNFAVLAYAATLAAVATLTRLRRPSVIVKYSRPIRSIQEADLRRDQFSALLSLFERYAKNPRYARGYRDMATTLVFDYGCPNTVPQLLWAKRDAYFPLFPEKTIPADLRAMFLSGDQHAATVQVSPEPPVNDSVAAAIDALPYSDRQLYTFLSAVGANAHFGSVMHHHLSLYAGLHIEDSIRLVESTTRLGLLSPRFRLTPRGRSELDRIMRRMPSPAFDGLTYPYYPRSLRGDGDN